MSHSFGFPVVLALALVACKGDGDPRAITDPSAELASIIEGQNTFALEVYDEARAEGGNTFFSPFSITAALGMTLAGARENTAVQMRDVLHVPVDDAVFHPELGALIADLGGDHDRAYELAIANRLFGQTGYPFLDPFLEITSTDYGAPLEPLDFRADPEGSRQHINGWVEEQTHDRIADLLPAGSITDGTRLVLANAIYFKGDWLAPFDKKNTSDQAFTLLDGSDVQVSTMARDGDMELGGDDVVDVLRLPYGGEELSMIVVLPKDSAGLVAVEDSLTLAQLDGWIASLDTMEGELTLPKFELEHRLPLKQTLIDLGMTDAFVDGVADFTGIADPGTTQERLFVTDALHKAFVKVDEEGTEAAAATAVVVGTESAPVRRPFHADHPFLYLIRDDLTETILFMGRIVDPR